jgi:hypothetical protein
MIADTRCCGRKNAISEPGPDEKNGPIHGIALFGVPSLGDDAEKFGATGCTIAASNKKALRI